MKIKWFHTIACCLILLGLTPVAQGAVLVYGDNFTLASGNLPYGSAYTTLPTNLPPSGEGAIEWANTTRSGFGGSFSIVDAGGSHGGVLRANDSTTARALNYATNIDLSTTASFNNGGAKDVLWSFSFDLNRNVNTFNWLWLYANYDSATGNGIGVVFNFGNASIKIVENGVESASLGNPGLVLGNAGLWGSFVFERYTDGTVRIAKTSGGQTGTVGDLDATVALANSNYSTGGTIAIAYQSNSGTPNPLYLDNLALTATSIPEPGSLMLLGLAGVGMAFYRHRSRSADRS